MSKEMIFDSEAREALRRGFSALAEAVRITLGPAGRHVALGAWGGAPALTGDAVLIAREIELADPFENMGAQLGREIHRRTHAEAGDGATTATVLADALLGGGAALADRGVNPAALKRGMEAALQEVTLNLAGMARHDGELGFSLSEEDAFIARRIQEAMEQTGKGGLVTFCSSDAREDGPLTVLPGCELDQGYLSPYFITDAEAMECSLEDVWIYLHHGRIDAFHELVPVLEQAAGSGKSLLIVAEEIGAEALATLVVNCMRGSLPLAAVAAPGWGRERGRILEDLAVLTGGRVCGPQEGCVPASQAQPQDLGWARHVRVTRTRTTLRGAGGDEAEIESRIRGLQAEDGPNLSSRRRRLLENRRRRLDSQIVVLPVGGATPEDVRRRRHRYEDIFQRARSMRQGGSVTGGGVALLRAGAGLPDRGRTDEEQGVALVKEALCAPLRQIVANAGWDPERVIRRLAASTDDLGFNAALGEYQDLTAAGVVDPYRVVRCALQHAVSMAAMILTTETLVAEIEDEEDAA